MKVFPGDRENELLQFFVEAFGKADCRISGRCDVTHYASWADDAIAIRVPEHGRHLCVEVKVAPGRLMVVEVPREPW